MRMEERSRSSQRLESRALLSVLRIAVRPITRSGKVDSPLHFGRFLLREGHRNNYSPRTPRKLTEFRTTEGWQASTLPFRTRVSSTGQSTLLRGVWFPSFP